MIFGAMPPFDLAAVRGRVPPDPLTRFAPSPTGYLHLGHVANAIWVWGVARALGGRVLLRIEDHDRGRSRTGYERAALEDLDWLEETARAHHHVVDAVARTRPTAPVRLVTVYGVGYKLTEAV